jgi:hypothetical protein
VIDKMDVEEKRVVRRRKLVLRRCGADPRYA